MSDTAKIKVLKLKKETIRNLSERQLAQMEGGTSAVCKSIGEWALSEFVGETIKLSIEASKWVASKLQEWVPVPAPMVPSDRPTYCHGCHSQVCVTND